MDMKQYIWHKGKGALKEVQSAKGISKNFKHKKKNAKAGQNLTTAMDKENEIRLNLWKVKGNTTVQGYIR